ncbi:14324_t:CDS:10 [Funneliformis geosporum]|nr:14324_t:CDS:10 [Funneliformis geosporum]
MTNIESDEFSIITEGKASILFPKDNAVFYNNVQQFNRDMSVAAIRTWSEIYLEEKEKKARKKHETGTSIAKSKFTILEALAASGLRSIRYAKEIPNIDYIVVNDLDVDAVNSINRNVEYNELSKELVRANQGDACSFMYQHREYHNRFDVVDIDPYGTAAPFLDAAVQSVQNGGLLCITCTDLAVLTGSTYPEKCYANYGSIPVRGEFCHEMALRILLNALSTCAARYQRQIMPLVSCSIDFYIRVFVRIVVSAAEPLAKMTEKNFVPMVGPIVNSKCKQCENKFHVGGPLWNSSMHDKEFVQRMLTHVKNSNKDVYGTHARMLGMLTVISEEIDVPLFHSISLLSRYKVSASHVMAGSVKTDAPMDVIWDVMRSWVKLHPVTMRNIAENSPARKLLAVEPSFIADFKIHKDAESPSRKVKLVRYQQNPEKNWGPKPRASGKRKLEVDNSEHQSAKKP